MSAFKVAFLVLSAAVLMVKAKPSHHLGLQAIPDHFDFAPPVLPPVPFHPEDEHAHAFDHGHVFDHGHFFDHGHAFDHGHFFDNGHVLDHGHAHILPPAPVFHEAPAAVFHGTPVALPCPAPVLPAHAHLLPAPAPLLPPPPPPPAHILRVAHVAPLLPAPAHFLPAAPAPVAPILPAPAPLLPAPLSFTRILPPVYEAIPFAPSYRAIPGPKTTTHHVAVGYAVPTLPIAHKLVASHVPHAHLRVAPLSLPHHHHHHHHALF